MSSLAADLLESSRLAAGWSRRALAASASASAPGLSEIAHGHQDATVARLDGLVRHLGYQLTALPTRRLTAARAGEVVRARLAENDTENALRAVWQLAADIGDGDPALRVALCVAPPAPTGDDRFDALLAAVVHHLLGAARLPVPAWVSDPSRVLRTPWDVEPVPSLRVRARELTPTRISGHGIFLDPDELVNR
jgi:transcriptional regulator with XRE-family HTH domain